MFARIGHERLRKSMLVVSYQRRSAAVDCRKRKGFEEREYMHLTGIAHHHMRDVLGIQTIGSCLVADRSGKRSMVLSKERRLIGFCANDLVRSLRSLLTQHSRGDRSLSLICLRHTSLAATSAYHAPSCSTRAFSD